MPKLLWREPIETTVITRAREDDAPQVHSGNGSAANGAGPNPEARSVTEK